MFAHLFFGNPLKGAGTQLKARPYIERKFIQVGKEPAHTERMPIQLERKHAMLEDRARTLGSRQV